MKKIILICFVIISMLSIGVSAALSNPIYLPLVNRMASTTQPPPPGVQILPNNSSYIDIFNTTHILGEVLNNTDIDIEYVSIAVNFFDGSGKLIETDYTYPYLDTLTALDKTCFELSVNVPASWSFYQFEIPTYSTYTQPLPSLSVFVDNAGYDPLNNYYEIKGQVNNDSVFGVYNVITVGTLYEATGKVVGCDFTYVDKIDLDPGQVSPFDLKISGRDYSGVTSYRIQAHGDP